MCQTHFLSSAAVVGNNRIQQILTVTVTINETSKNNTQNAMHMTVVTCETNTLYCMGHLQ